MLATDSRCPDTGCLQTGGHLPAVARIGGFVMDAEVLVTKLLAYCRRNDWAGYDPYDALNSRILIAMPFLNGRLPRLILTQTLKRSPVNLRPLLLVPKRQNPKALALFLSAFAKLSKGGTPDLEKDSESMLQRLIALRSPGSPYWCWGYSFPWQTRTVVVPRWAPNLVCTAFVANSLLDAYQEWGDPRCFTMALSAAEYLINELFWETSESAGFSYPIPSVRVPVHNANLLAAALLCRMYAQTREERFLAPALAATRYSAGRQHADGSWHYGEAPSQQWVDNFHTGYNLCALDSISRYAENAEFDDQLKRGFSFYRAKFFRKDGAVKYFHDRTYPIDIHCVAQSIITLATFGNADNIATAQSVLDFAFKHLWDERGFFHYRVLRLCTVRISYMRWSQAWMLLALATLLDKARCGGTDRAESRVVVPVRRACG